MEFDTTDLFVGGVAIALGGTALVAGLVNWEASYRLPKMKKIEARFGRTTARVFYAVLGVGLIVLGMGIIAGFGPYAS